MQRADGAGDNDNDGDEGYDGDRDGNSECDDGAGSRVGEVVNW